MRTEEESAAYLGVLGVLLGLRVRQVDSYGSMGEAGFLVAFFVAALLCVGQASSAIFVDNSTLGWLFDNPGHVFMVGINLFLVGLLVLGIATLRAGVLPCWCGFALIGVVAVSIFGAIVSAGLAFVAVGLLWVAVGYALRSEKPRRGK